MCVFVCVCVCMSVCRHVCVFVCERERERVCLCVWERESVCVCVRERESVCVCVCEREKECVCLCVCERERGRASKHRLFSWSGIQRDSSFRSSLTSDQHSNERLFSQSVSSFYVVFLTFYVDHLKTFLVKCYPRCQWALVWVFFDCSWTYGFWIGYNESLLFIFG